VSSPLCDSPGRSCDRLSYRTQPRAIEFSSSKTSKFYHQRAPCRCQSRIWKKIAVAAQSQSPETLPSPICPTARRRRPDCTAMIQVLTMIVKPSGL
jgi:hypothetical protein